MHLPPPITSRSNARVKALRAAFGGKASQPGELVGVEGSTLVFEAHLSGLTLAAIFLRDQTISQLPAEISGLLSAESGRTHVLGTDVFDNAVDTRSPQGIAALFQIPRPHDPDISTNSGTMLVLEDIQDPGNLGTLIRSAEAFGVQQIFLTPACANQWSPKVIRSSAGSVFRVPIHRGPIDRTLHQLHSSGVRIAGAVVQSDESIPSSAAPLGSPLAIVIGNEGAGLSQQALALVDLRVNIPCRTESLNAAIAGSLLLYEAQRQSAEREAEPQHAAEAV